MPTELQNKKVFSLAEVTASIKQTLENRYTSAFWVAAEMHKLNYYKHSGHCYPDLLERRDEKVIAQMRATLWRDDYRVINKKFIDVLKEPLRDGIKILLLARITFDAIHGLGLQILDLDPAFTLGDIEREKQETLSKLKAENIIHANKHLPLPLLPKRIAVISVETSKGYADFMQVIQTNSWGYKFFIMLFPSLLQGEKAVGTITSQLRRIERVKHRFDAVAIIRGGGGDVGLSCYNNYRLAKAIACFPLPVLTGIGHSTNETVCEMIAHTNAITPTKLAELLIQKFHNFSVPVQEAEKYIVNHARQILESSANQLHAEIKLFRSVAEHRLAQGKHRQTESISRLQQYANAILSEEKRKTVSCRETIAHRSIALVQQQKSELNHKGIFIGKDALNQMQASHAQLRQVRDALKSALPRSIKILRMALEHTDEKIRALHPDNILKRGFSITTVNGRLIQRPDAVKAGDTLQTQLHTGTIISEVLNTHKKEKNE